MYTHTRVYINVYEYIYTVIHIYIYIHIRMHLYTHTCTHIYIRMHVHTYAHIENLSNNASEATKDFRILSLVSRFQTIAPLFHFETVDAPEPAANLIRYPNELTQSVRDPRKKPRQPG